MANFYLALCVVGVVVPYGFFLPWLLDNGLDVSLFITELVSTRVGAFFGADVIVSAGCAHRVRLHRWSPRRNEMAVGPGGRDSLRRGLARTAALSLSQGAHPRPNTMRGPESGSGSDFAFVPYSSLAPAQRMGDNREREYSLPGRRPNRSCVR